MGPSSIVFNDFKLTNIRYAAEGVSLFELSPIDKRVLEHASAGSHLDIRFSNGVIRQYSLITPLCSTEHYTIAVKREPSGLGGSVWLHDQVRVGDHLELSDTRNNFQLSHSQAPCVLLAGGIGITPIYAMYHELKSQGRSVELHYWCRSIEQCLFYEALISQDDVSIYISGKRPTITHIVQTAPTEAEFYCCGPTKMISELDQMAPQLGSHRVHIERFQAAPSVSTVSDSFTVVLARSGKEIKVTPEQSILEALMDEDIDVMFSCEQGICGACEQTVLEGEPIHQDSIATPTEHDSRKTIMICCSTSASSRLVLDL